MEETKSKYAIIKKLLLDEFVIVQINTASPNVSLPEHLMKEPSVSLKLSTLFSGVMEVTEENISATLSFNMQYFNCTIPLDSIWSVISVKNQLTIWPESVPKNLGKSKDEETKSGNNTIPNKNTKNKKAFLKRVK